MSDIQEQRIEGDKGLDRIIFFSDAIFAIAMTLLVLDTHTLEIPSNLVAAELLPRVLGL